MLESTKEEYKHAMIAEIIPTARAKLLLENDVTMDYQNLRPHAKLAILDIGLMLEFEPRRQATRNIGVDLVSGHMAIVYSVPQKREYLRCGYPSEPILAEAAARQMAEFRKQDPNAVLSILQLNVVFGLLDVGELGELVARELIVSAYDRAIEREQAHLPSHNYSAGVSVVTFIQELFAPELAEEILNCKPDNVKSAVPLGDAFKDATVRFTHWGKMMDNTGTTTNAMWVAFVRAMAIICRSGNGAVDVIFLILLWDTKLREEVMSGLLIQIKRRAQAGTVQAYEINARDIRFFPSTSTSNPATTLV